LHHLKRAKLKLVNQYIIHFTGLSDGIHNLTFSFGKLFFDEHKVLEARDGDITAEVLLKKKPGMLEIHIELSGLLEIQCDRCLEFFKMPVKYSGDLVVKFGEDASASTDEIWIISPNENTLDLNQYFYECIGLTIPIQKVHSDNEDGSSACNPEMLQKLNSLSIKEKVKKESDPRWNKLKDLLNNLNTI
jgi:uncharacterized metal-binding protein YceD (DUF177 family)